MNQIPADWLEKEKQAGRNAAVILQESIRQGAFSHYRVGQTPTRRTKEDSIGRIRVQPVMENQELNALRLVVPPHAMILNYGWERQYTNGAMMRMAGSAFVVDPLYESGALENLASEIARLRADAVVDIVKLLPRRV